MEKSRKTLRKFVENKLYTDYDKLLIFQIVKKTNHRTPSITEGQITLNTKDDIFDIEDLIKKITSFKTEKLDELWNIIHYETSSLLLDKTEIFYFDELKELSLNLHHSFRPENLVDFFPDASEQIVHLLDDLKKTPRYVYQNNILKNKSSTSENSFNDLINELIKKSEKEQDRKSIEVDSSSQMSKSNRIFILAAGGSGKTVTMWNACKYISDTVDTILPIYIHLGEFIDIDQIDNYFLKLGNYSFTEFMKGNSFIKVILFFDGWDELYNNANKSDQNLYHSYISK